MWTKSAPASEITPLGNDGRRVKLRPSAWLSFWFLMAPVVALAMTALVLSLSNLLHHHRRPSAWLSVAIAVPLGGWIVGSFFRAAGRWVVGHLFPEEVELGAGRVKLLLRGDALSRRQLWFDASELRGSWLDRGQGTAGFVWLLHATGWSLLLTEDQHLDEARALTWDLS